MLLGHGYRVAFTLENGGTSDYKYRVVLLQGDLIIK